MEGRYLQNVPTNSYQDAFLKEMLGEVINICEELIDENRNILNFLFQIKQLLNSDAVPKIFNSSETIDAWIKESRSLSLPEDVENRLMEISIQVQLFNHLSIHQTGDVRSLHPLLQESLNCLTKKHIPLSRVDEFNVVEIMKKLTSLNVSEDVSKNKSKSISKNKRKNPESDDESFTMPEDEPKDKKARVNDAHIEDDYDSSPTYLNNFSSSDKDDRSFGYDPLPDECNYFDSSQVEQSLSVREESSNEDEGSSNEEKSLNEDESGRRKRMRAT